jgi:hypothetical protein
LDVVIENRMVILKESVSVNSLVIGDGGILVFDDPSKFIPIGPGLGKKKGAPIDLRAKYIKVKGSTSTAELWIGSRSCRYQHKASITLYGNYTDMEEHIDGWVLGHKFLWAGYNGVVELHGKEKVAWTFLQDHAFALNSPVEPVVHDMPSKPQLTLHRFTPYGDLKEIKAFQTMQHGDQVLIDYFDLIDETNDDIFFLFTEGMYHWPKGTIFDELNFHEFSNEAKQAISAFFGHTANWGGDSNHGRFAILGRRSGSTTTEYLNSVTFEEPSFGIDFGSESGGSHINGTLKIDLHGSKSGYEMEIFVDLYQPWFDEQNAEFPNADDYRAVISYMQPSAYTAPIISLAEDVTSWEAGDTIVIASTDYNPYESETFQLQKCKECLPNQVKLDRYPTYTHWGRIDPRTGADQRAEVGILSRNVVIKGEMSQENKCQYAKTLDSLNPSSANYERNFCFLFEGEGDQHGGHVIFTAGIRNVHITHIEITNAGQPQLARYPLHWHYCGDVGTTGGYQDPSIFDSNSIHNSFSRFITIHGTNNGQVTNNVGFNCRGSGYFIEDGTEYGTIIENNLGIISKAGIVLPTDRDSTGCAAAMDGYENQKAGNGACIAYSVFWITHLETYLNGNRAVGGIAGYWVLPHTGGNNWLRHPPAEGWTGNKASAAKSGAQFESVILTTSPKASEPGVPTMGKKGGRQVSCYDYNTYNGCFPVILDQWAFHHTSDHGIWIRQSTVIMKNSMFSDCPKGITFPTSDCAGQHQEIVDSTFVGFTENTGTYTCSWSQGKWTTSGGLRTCNNHNRKAFPDFGHVFWYQTPDGVYRSQGKNIYWPNRGIQVYDTFIPTHHDRNKFYDYPMETDTGGVYEKRVSAVGFHLHNRFGMEVGTSTFDDNEFCNVGRKVYFGTADPDDPYMNQFGTNTVGHKREWLADGEISSSLWDRTGEWTSRPNSLVIAVENKFNLEENCEYDELINGMVCPMTQHDRYVGFPMRYDITGSWGSNIRNESDLYHFAFYQNRDPSSPTTKEENSHVAGKANRDGYHLRWPTSPPPEGLSFIPHRLEKGDWVRMSFCLQGAEPLSIEQMEYYQTYNGYRSLRLASDNDRETLIDVRDMEEMNSINDRPSWFFDELGWLHLKIVGEYDLHEAGNTTYNGEFFEWEENAYKRCNTHTGCPTIRWRINNQHADRKPCPMFDMVETPCDATLSKCPDFDGCVLTNLENPILEVKKRCNCEGTSCSDCAGNGCNHDENYGGDGKKVTCLTGTAAANGKLSGRVACVCDGVNPCSWQSQDFLGEITEAGMCITDDTCPISLYKEWNNNLLMSKNKISKAKFNANRMQIYDDNHAMLYGRMMTKKIKKRLFVDTEEEYDWAAGHFIVMLHDPDVDFTNIVYGPFGYINFLEYSSADEKASIFEADASNEAVSRATTGNLMVYFNVEFPTGFDVTKLTQFRILMVPKRWKASGVWVEGTLEDIVKCLNDVVPNDTGKISEPGSKWWQEPWKIRKHKFKSRK